jgi:chromosome partitioning protein
MPVTTAVVNQKGGVGKTTTALNVGASLAERGRRVLFVDLDPQSTLSLACGLGVGTTNAMHTVADLLLDRDADPREAIVTTAVGPDLIPSRVGLAQTEYQMMQQVKREYVLKEQIAKLVDSYDHVLVDCSPSLGLLVVNALTAAGRVIVPCQTDSWAIAGLVQIEQTMALVRKHLNPALPDPIILPTMLDVRINHDREVLTLIKRSRPDAVLDAVVRRSARVKDANAAGAPLLRYDPAHPATAAYRALAEALDDAA